MMATRSEQRFDWDWIIENPDYIEILKEIIEHEEGLDPAEFEDNNTLERHNEEEGTDHSVHWINTDVGYPTRLYYLEEHGFLDRTYNSSSKTYYTMDDWREEIKSQLEEIDPELTPVQDGEQREVYFDFPDSEDDLPDTLFEDIVGLDDKKWLLKRGLTTEGITNFLLLGPSGTAKSVFLLSIFEHFEQSEYIVASEASSAGVLDELFRLLPKVFLVDEFDDMDSDHQSVFASYTETGILKETKSGKNRRVKTNIKTIAAANERSKIKDNILDRFAVLEFEPYTYGEFKEICVQMLPRKEGKTEGQAAAVADAVWDYQGEGDVRAAIQVARLSRGDPERVVQKLDSEDDGLLDLG